MVEEVEEKHEKPETKVDGHRSRFEVGGLERGPLSLVSETTEELLE
jgi:hypothetical protein